MNNILIGLIIAYTVTTYLYPLKCGEYPVICPTVKPLIHNGLIKIPITSKKAIHVHHWIIACIAMFVMVYIHMSDIAIGIAIGFFIHGLGYSDCFDLICENPYGDKIYSE